MSLVAIALLACVWSSAWAGDDASLVLNDDNFKTQIRTNNFFVAFIRDRKFDDFDDFWKKVTNLYNKDSKGKLKFARVECLESPKICAEGKVNEPISVQFFGKKSDDYETMAEFFESTIKKTLKKAQEEEKALVNIKKGNALVLFMLRDCPRCKEIAPQWKKLFDSPEDHKKYRVASIDCDKFESVCSKYRIEEYPTILFMVDGNTVETFTNEYYMKEDFESFAEKMIRKHSQVVAKRVKRYIHEEKEEEAPEDQHRLELTPDNFDRVIGKDFTFVKYYLKWCKHCKEVDDVWGDVIKHFADSKNVKIAQVNCETAGDICSREVKGCPTLNLYSNGLKIVEDYHEDFSLASLIDCVESNVKGGEDLEDWHEREHEKRRLRKIKERKEKSVDKKKSKTSI